MVEGFRGTQLIEPALAHHGDPVRQVERLLLVVGHIEGRNPNLLDQAAELTPCLFTQCGVKVG